PYRYRTALRLFAENRGRLSDEAKERLLGRAIKKPDPQALWALNATSERGFAVSADGMAGHVNKSASLHPSDSYRGWAARLIAASEGMDVQHLREFGDFAKIEESAPVRLQFASIALKLGKQHDT